MLEDPPPLSMFRRHAGRVERVRREIQPLVCLGGPC